MARPKPTIQLGMTVNYHPADDKTESVEVVGAVPLLYSTDTFVRSDGGISPCAEPTGEYELTVKRGPRLFASKVPFSATPLAGHWSWPERLPDRTTVATVKVGIEYDEAQLDGLIAKLKTVNALQDRLTAAGENVGVFRERLRGVALSADVAESLIQIIRSRII